MEIMDNQAEIMNRFTEDINSFETKTKVKKDDENKSVTPATSEKAPQKMQIKGNGGLYMARLNSIINSLDDINTSN
jgi:hypothetical protein